jgi:hypothetical protein
MRFVLLPFATVAMLASSAHADELGAPDGAPETTHAPGRLTGLPNRTGVTTTIPVAIGVNFPTGWADANSIAGSLYVGVTKKDAIRVNAASYRYTSSAVGDLIGLAYGADGDEASRSGRITDLGVGFVHYSRGLWDGLTVEVGALRRAKEIRINDSAVSLATVATTSTTYAGRALLGWSWLIKRHAFIAFAVGMSLGIEHGTDHTETTFRMPMMTVDIDRTAIGGEGYLRFGGTFDL